MTADGPLIDRVALVTGAGSGLAAPRAPADLVRHLMCDATYSGEVLPANGGWLA